MSSNFERRLAQHLSSKLSVSINDVEEALNSFGIDNLDPISNKIEEKVIQKKRIPEKSDILLENEENFDKTKKKNDEQHLCERIKRGHDEACGKPAKRYLEINGKQKWLCGGEKSNCYYAEKKLQTVSEMNKSTLVSKEITKKQPITNAAIKKNLTDNKAKSKESVKALIDRVIPESELNLKTIKTSKGETLCINMRNRALYDENTEEFYGILGDDNETILELNKETIRWAETSNFTVRIDKSKVQQNHISRDPPKKIESSASDGEINDLSDEDTLED